MTTSPQSLRAAILIISDTAADEPDTDKAEKVLRDGFEQDGGGQWTVAQSTIVPDQVLAIQHAIKSWCDKEGEELFNLVITTGGTGFATKDVTPEAVDVLLEKKAPGLV